MRAFGDLLVGLFLLAVFAAAGFGVWSAVGPDEAKGVRDRAVRAAERLTDESDGPAEHRQGRRHR